MYRNVSSLDKSAKRIKVGSYLADFDKNFQNIHTLFYHKCFHRTVINKLYKQTYL